MGGEMKIEFTVKFGWGETRVVIDGEPSVVELSVDAVKKAVKKYSDNVEIK